MRAATSIQVLCINKPYGAYEIDAGLNPRFGRRKDYRPALYVLYISAKVTVKL